MKKTGLSPLGVIVCVNERLPGKPSCGGRGSQLLADDLERVMKQRGLQSTVERVYCIGRCREGPNVRIFPGGCFFHGVGPQDVAAILDNLEKVINIRSAPTK